MKEFRKSSRLENQPKMYSPELFAQGVPTLMKDVYRRTSPMLQERYELFGRWANATHGDWLGIEDMKSLWNEKISDPILDAIRLQRISAEENWPNEASALFRKDRLSLFAGSDYGNEKIYLLWLDFEPEPELWVYDSNGESRYKNLNDYLTSFLTDDVSAAEQSWRAQPLSVLPDIEREL